MKVRKRLTDSKIGLVPLNWNFTDDRKVEVIGKFKEYGFLGIQISEIHANSETYRTLFEKNKIAAAELYIAIKCEIDTIARDSDEQTKRQIDSAKSGQVEMIVFAVDGTLERDRIASNAHQGPSLSNAGLQELASHLNKWSRYANSLNMKTSFHPHAATFIETPEETRNLFLLLEEQVGLCLDVGHWLVGGGDPVSAVLEYGERITHVHVKDVDAKVLEKLKTGGFEGMEIAVTKEKLFAPAGTGILELKELFIALEKVEFSGWLMSEQDSAWEPSEEKSLESFRNISYALET